MKKLLTLALLLAALPVFAAPAAISLPPAPDIAARSYTLVDFSSGQTLQQRGGDERMEPASLTKLMTAYLTFSALRQGVITKTQALPVSERAWRAEGSRMFIQPNTPVAVDDLIRGMIVQSGNDACVTLAEGIAGSEEEFVRRMNLEAQRLGMKNTHFMNATGLPHPQHYTTARDLSLLAQAIIRVFPEYYPLYSLKEYKYNNITQANRNRLLWQDPTVDGMKTGHTESAGFCLIASAKRESRRLLSVVLGTTSESMRASESQKLLNYGFQNFDTHHLYQKSQLVASLPVWKGSENILKAGAAQDIYISLPKGQYARLKAALVSKQPLLAPISVGQTVGSIRLTMDNKPYAEYPLVALEGISTANFFKRGWDGIKLWFN
ncbi:MAG: peptidase [Betaproteobacteria bacterium CG2_30_59_46]|nr:MAG: peptidase [Betaproteobacteria bacterium CG2_30_59_46]PIQ13817.1 MAG: peptidase [Hydrogenophilales bacterium CG18_big_fil_WC_8_21_14_2_50_58_12]PIX99908.1 MAG: peptidase [Hydrogenophilales bacterium CG_4_10_14_3_um_filter_58_23]PJB03501.1 MAG: peptidase [Hydrogenophilales bacterium CG_4_9_14_3_um_filter_59_35]